MKLASLAAVILFGTILTRGNAWQGTITETVTSSTDPRFYVGEVFTGSYQYVSTAADGTFYVNRASTPEPNASLTGLLFDGTRGDPAHNGLVPIEAAPYNSNHITVIGGMVTEFIYQDESGGNQWIGGVGPSRPFTFAFYPMVDPNGGTSTVLGTIAFSTPTDPPLSVPDEADTATLLAIAALGFGWARHRFMK